MIVQVAERDSAEVCRKTCYCSEEDGEVRIEIPDKLATWHILSRAGIPPWTELQVKTFCGGPLRTEQQKRALLKIFGTTPNIKVAQKFQPRFGKKDTAEAHYIADADSETENSEDDDWN